MQRRSYFIRIFLVFFIIAVIIFIFAKNNLMGGFIGILESITIPIQRNMYSSSHGADAPMSEIEKLQEENTKLQSALAEMKNMQAENTTLKEQFKSTVVPSRKLLPAHVLGFTNDTLIIDKGSSDGLKGGTIVIVKDNLVGTVSKLTAHIAVINTVTNKNLSSTVKDVQTSALGIVRGEGKDGILFDLVDLSEKLAVGDLVETKGDVDGNNSGIPPGLIIGKIRSVNKKTSSIFQSAEVESLLPFEKLQMVFVLTD